MKGSGKFERFWGLPGKGLGRSSLHPSELIYYTALRLVLIYQVSAQRWTICRVLFGVVCQTLLPKLCLSSPEQLHAEHRHGRYYQGGRLQRERERKDQPC